MNLKRACRISTFFVLGYVSVIYLTLPVMRPVLNYLKAQLGARFSLLTDIALIAVMAGLAIILVKNKVTWKQCIWALIVFCLYGYGLKVLTIPEERIHLLEYGFLSYLVFKMYRSEQLPLSLFWQSFLTVSFLGTLDEIIQYFIPSRVGDVRDIILNIVSGLLGLVLTVILTQKPTKNLSKNT